MLSPGTVVGRYRVAEYVGGDMAEVYRAVDEHGLSYAMKLLGPATAQTRREAAVVTRLSHPNIVYTYDVVDWDGRVCLIQEWVEGESLAAVLDSAGSLGLDETVRMGINVATALTYAHDHGVLHRDIKPSNVLRTVDGHYKLVDFGAVGLLDPKTQQTRSGEIAGTPQYMSPEQAVGTAQTLASDVFGLGLLLYRCLYGTIPGESAQNYIELLRSRAQTPITVPPSPIQDLLERCLAIDPMRRPQSAGQVQHELNRIAVTHLPPATQSMYEPFDWAPGGPGQQGYGPEVFAEPSKAPRSRITAVIAGLVLVGGLVWLIVLDPGLWLRITAGLAIAGVGLLVARWVRRLASKAPDTERQAAGILTGAGDREALTKSMVLEVDQVVAKLKGLDAKFLGYTMVMLIQEAQEATESADRVAALAQMVTLMEKLTKQLSPWHVRHKEAIATSIAIVGSLVGVASVVSGFLR